MSMLRFVLAVAMALSTAVCQAEVTLDSASARAVLSSVLDSKLTLERAREVCKLPGNQGLVQKEVSYGRKATTEDCADALLAASQHRVPDPAFRFGFEAVKLRASELNALLDRIDENPIAFQGWIASRVGQFSPKNMQSKIVGHLVVGGVSGGFAFGRPEFYLNVAYFDEFDTARIVMAHELYHAVQGVYKLKQTDWWNEEGADKGPDAAQAKQCSTTNALFRSLYQEGSASYVGDPLLLSDATSVGAKKLVTDMKDGLAHLSTSVTLLELSVTGLDAPNPVPFEQVYAIGFYVPEIEYKLGYAMAKAIAEQRGADAIIALLQQPGYAFVDAYIRLPRYGTDTEHPKLGPNTISALSRLEAGCPRPVPNR